MRRVEKLEEVVERERMAQVEVTLYWVNRETGKSINIVTGEEVTGVVFD
jgi:hypothetical protein